MTPTPDNSSSNRLDRIEAILEQTARNRQNDLEQAARERQSDREETRELRSALTRLSTRVDNLTERVIRFEERTLESLTESTRWRSLAGQLLRTLTENQARQEDILASLQAGQEKQDRLLDYIMRRTNGDNA